MIDTFFSLPLPFYLSLLALAVLVVVAWQGRHAGWGIPMAMVLGTIAVWYHGDALYNDYEEYRVIMGDDALAAGWWQVLWFLVAFGMLVPAVHGQINGRMANQKSHFMRYLLGRRLEHPQVQKRIDRLFKAMLISWLSMMAVGLYLVDFNFIGLFAPYLAEKADPWGRGRIGGGFDAVLSLATNIQILLTAGFGVLAAVARNPSTRATAIFVCFLALPFFLFDRTRNTMLAVALPGMLAWILFRVRGGLMMKGAVLLAAFLVVNFWFTLVIANRSKGAIASVFQSEEAAKRAADTKHEGISMFSELGYMNHFFDKGTLEPSWGGRYFAELANPVPRALWKNKPLVGIDYAVARGFGSANSNSPDAGVTATIATGMIGQGVVNFGRWFGPLAAAFLMAGWVSVLARLDLTGSDPARLLLYAVGMILTFNMGRDITFLVLYPFVFGWILLKMHHWFEQQMNGSGPGRRVRRSRRRPIPSKVAPPR